MSLTAKKEHVFNDPVLTRIAFRKDIPYIVYLRFKYHFLFPLVVAALSTYHLIFWIQMDTSSFTRTDFLLFLIVSLIYVGGDMLALRLTDFTVLAEMFERREVKENDTTERNH